MLVRLLPSSDQVRWYAQTALNGFDTLDLIDAVENAKNDLQAILAYLDALDRANDAVLVPGIKSIESGVRLELAIGKLDQPDHSHLEDPGLQSV